MATHSSVLAWRIPGMVEPGGLLSMLSHRVRHDWSDLAAAPAHCGLEPSTVTLHIHWFKCWVSHLLAMWPWVSTCSLIWKIGGVLHSQSVLLRIKCQAPKPSPVWQMGMMIRHQSQSKKMMGAWRLEGRVSDCQGPCFSLGIASFRGFVRWCQQKSAVVDVMR